MISVVLQLCAAIIIVNLPLAYLVVADNLLEIKKQKLLLIFQGSTASPSDPPPLSSSTSSSSSSSSYSSTTLSCTLPTQSDMVCSSESAHQVENKEEGEEGEDDFQGTRCQAPLKEVF